MSTLRKVGHLTARGLLSLAMAYVLIVKLTIGAAATTVVLPEAGLDPVICLSDHTGATQPAGLPGTPDAHRCDDCSLHRIAAAAALPPEAGPGLAILHAGNAVAAPWPSLGGASPPREAWGPTRAQRGPPASA